MIGNKKKNKKMCQLTKIDKFKFQFLNSKTKTESNKTNIMGYYWIEQGILDQFPLFLGLYDSVSDFVCAAHSLTNVPQGTQRSVASCPSCCSCCKHK